MVPRTALRKGVESSLDNLRTDYIDLYRVHWPDPHTPSEETAGASRNWLEGGRSATPACPTTKSTRCKRLGVLAYGPMAHGLLAGRMVGSTTFNADDWRSKSPDFTGDTFRCNLAVVERQGLARERDISLVQLAVVWTLANPAVHVAIVGGMPTLTSSRLHCRCERSMGKRQAEWGLTGIGYSGWR